jgi:hypothetical protein
MLLIRRRKRTAAPFLRSFCGPACREQPGTDENGRRRATVFARIFPRVPGCSRKMNLSGRQDLNLRPPGPQPGALPDCATPRDASILRSLAASAVRLLCEHMFVPRESQQTRRCGRCSQSKPLDEFAWHRKAKGQRDNYCRPCRAAYKQEHYAAHRERYIANASIRKRALIAERTAYLIEFFRERPCTDCGEADPLVLEFDHTGHKSFSISVGIRGHKWQSVLDEIEQCDVVCANCHRRRTALRGGFIRALAQNQG